MRLLITAIVLSLVFCVPFLFWGEDLARGIGGDSVADWIRGWGGWGWLAVIVLLALDLVLPIPATPVMSASGFVYGIFLGGLLNATGSYLAGLTGYGVCRLFGRGAAVRLVGEEQLSGYETRFQRHGAWLVAASRWVPLLPEVITCLAGLARMRFRTFAVALACGTVPTAFAFAAIGVVGKAGPREAFILSALVPLLLWAVARHWLNKSTEKPSIDKL
jgi:uncharacterized membrane protein YdjX (TVP38/TMEM64 family)